MCVWHRCAPRAELLLALCSQNRSASPVSVLILLRRGWGCAPSVLRRCGCSVFAPSTEEAQRVHQLHGQVTLRGEKRGQGGSAGLREQQEGVWGPFALTGAE